MEFTEGQSNIPVSDKDTRIWGMLCHLSALSALIGIPFGNIIGPLIIWLIKKDEYAFVDDQGKESLNFQISMTIFAVGAAILILLLIGIPILIAVVVLDLIFTIIASIKANEGIYYRYPFSLKIIK
jgi:uncharacterized Tic20 family protein